jgi:hypothetical protein
MSIFDCRYIAAGLLAALSLVVGPREAKANPILGIIVTGGTVMPTGDPTLSYDFQLSIAPTSQVQNGDFMEFTGIPGSYLAFSYAPNQNALIGDFTITETPDGSGTDIKFEYTAVDPPTGPLHNPNSTCLPIGDLLVTTTIGVLPILTNPISYSTQGESIGSKNTVTTNDLSVTPSVVPEPASVALYGFGLASAWLLTRRRRSRGPSLPS